MGSRSKEKAKAEVVWLTAVWRQAKLLLSLLLVFSRYTLSFVSVPTPL